MVCLLFFCCAKIVIHQQFFCQIMVRVFFARYESELQTQSDKAIQLPCVRCLILLSSLFTVHNLISVTRFIFHYTFLCLSEFIHRAICRWGKWFLRAMGRVLYVTRPVKYIKAVSIAGRLQVSALNFNVKKFY